MSGEKNRSRLPTSFTLSPRAKTLLESLVDYYGTNKSAVVEMVIRQHARELGILRGPERVDGEQAGSPHPQEGTGD